MEAAAEAAGDEDDVLEADGGVLRAVAEGAARKRRHGRPGILVDVVPLGSGANVPILKGIICLMCKPVNSKLG